jgi:PBP1b-binding outer membrane lipoprotein LpoB
MHRSLIFSIILLAVGCSKPEPEVPVSSAPKVDQDGEPLVAPDAGVVEAAEVVDSKRPGEAKAPTLAQLQPQFAWTQPHPLARPGGIKIMFSEAIFGRRSRDIDQTLITVEPQVKGKLQIANPYTLHYNFHDKVPMSASFKVQLRAL